VAGMGIREGGNEKEWRREQTGQGADWSRRHSKGEREKLTRGLRGGKKIESSRGEKWRRGKSIGTGGKNRWKTLQRS